MTETPEATAATAFAEARTARNEAYSYNARLQADIGQLRTSIVEIAQAEIERRVRAVLAHEKRAARVLFMTPHTSMFDVFLPIYRRMEASPLFQPEVLAFRRVDVDVTESAADVISFFDELNIKPNIAGHEADGFLPEIDENYYDVIFYTLGSIAYPEKYKIEHLSRKFLTCYIAYGFLQVNEIDYQFNQSFHHSAWRIYAATSREQGLYKLHCPRSRSNTVKTGYPKFDLYVDRPPHPRPERPMVIWAPHWSVGLVYPPLRIGMFDQLCMPMLKVMQDFPDIDFLYKPHPNLPHALEKTGYMNRDNYKIYIQMLESNSNVRIWNHGDNIRLFQQSSGMITDSVSFLAEYLPSGQPLLFLDRPDRLPFADVGEEIINLHYRGRDEGSIRDFLRDVIAGGSDPKQPLREQSHRSILGIAPQTASAQILSDLSRALHEEQRPRKGFSLTEANARRSGALEERAAVDAVARGFWLKQSTWEEGYAVTCAQRHEEQTRFTAEHFLPLLTRESRVIDLGCADGWHSLQVARICGTLVGYDLNEQFIARATVRAKQEALANCTFITADVTRLSLDEASAEAVIASGLTTCLVHDDEISALFGQVFKTLTDNGILLLRDTLSRTSVSRLHTTNGYAACYRSLDAYRALVNSQSLDVIAERWLDTVGDTGSYMILARKT